MSCLLSNLGRHRSIAYAVPCTLDVQISSRWHDCVFTPMALTPPHCILSWVPLLNSLSGSMPLTPLVSTRIHPAGIIATGLLSGDGFFRSAQCLVALMLKVPASGFSPLTLSGNTLASGNPSFPNMRLAEEVHKEPNQILLSLFCSSLYSLQYGVPFA